MSLVEDDLFCRMKCNGSCLSSWHAGTTDLLDLLLGQLGEELGLDDHRLLWETALAEHLEEALQSTPNISLASGHKKKTAL